LTGEEALERALVSRGFTAIASETLPFVEQLALFSTSDIIVGPHGAGLANLVWARPGTRIVELFPAAYFNDCYASLAMMSNLSYDYVICRATNPHVDEAVIEDVIRRVTGS
jgi:capsular polysaccharide biosynthesis protein